MRRKSPDFGNIAFVPYIVNFVVVVYIPALIGRLLLLRPTFSVIAAKKAQGERAQVYSGGMCLMVLFINRVHYADEFPGQL